MKEISNKFDLNSREFWKGLKLAVLGAVSGYVYNILTLPNFDFLTAFTNWHPLVNSAILAGGLYIVKTFTEGEAK